MHVTEFGYETHRIGSRPLLSPATQARWLTWAEYVCSHVPGVVSFAQFLLRDQPPGKVRVSTSKARAFGQYYTGLLTTRGVPKLAARSFVAGLFARRSGPRRVLLWARLRLGAGPRTIAIQRRRPGGSWRPQLTATVDGQGSFQRVVPAAPGTRYRVRYPAPGGGTATGLTITPVG